jgi:hypothetical protein
VTIRRRCGDCEHALVEEQAGVTETFNIQEYDPCKEPPLQERCSKGYWINLGPIDPSDTVPYSNQCTYFKLSKKEYLKALERVKYYEQQ